MTTAQAEVEVVATAKGYFGGPREVGEKFSVPAGTKFGKWFQAAPAKAAPVKPSAEDLA